MPFPGRLDRQPSPWCFVPVHEFQPPAPKVTETARTGWSTFWHRVRPPKPPPPPKPRHGLAPLPECLLAEIAPEPDWQEAAEALDRHLAGWLEQVNPESPVLALVLPPHNGHPDILTAWARLRGLPLLSPPEYDRITTGGQDWLSRWGERGRLWILPALERLCLRRVGGLDLIRRFFAQALSDPARRGIIGCDSWAWQFLRHVWQGPLPSALTLQALDGPSLAGYLQRPGQKAGRARTFRKADNGESLLPLPASTDEPAKVHDWFYSLAVYSRGNLGIAWSYWRASLRSGPEGSAGGEAEADSKDSAPVVWVAAWDQFQHPALPEGAGWEEGSLLHGLLLHNGLPSIWLDRILPLPTHRLTALVLRMESRGLVEQCGDGWRVSAPGYPAVRKFLQSAGFLTDAF